MISDTLTTIERLGGEMKSFDDAWKENRHVFESTKNLAKAMYLDGQQSRQAEVDGAFMDGYHSRQGAISKLENSLADSKFLNDELQERIDKALKILEGMRHNGAYRAIEALKAVINDPSYEKNTGGFSF